MQTKKQNTPKAKYQLFIMKRGGAGLKHCNDSKALLNAQMI